MPNLRQLLTASITRRYPFYSGCGTLANSNVVKFFSGTQSGEAWCQVPGGEVLADLSDYVGRAAFFVGDLDRKVTWVCKQIVRDGDTVFDIGANMGIVTVLLADLAGENGKVHSFEPNPLLSDVIKQTIIRNNIRNTTFHPIALGSKQDKLSLHVPDANAGRASLIRHREQADCHVFHVPVAPLDDICRNEDIHSIRLIKIDVEGFETDVLSGATHVLSTIRPDAILFELNTHPAHQLSEDPLIKLLDSFEYDFFMIPKHIYRMKLQAWDPKSQIGAGHDCLASPKGNTFSEIARLVKADD